MDVTNVDAYSSGCLRCIVDAIGSAVATHVTFHPCYTGKFFCVCVFFFKNTPVK